MAWTSTSSPDTTWQAVSPGAAITNTLLTQVQAEVASAQAAQAAAETAETNAASSASAAASSASAAASSATSASDSATDASTFATQAQSAAASLTPIPTGGTTGQSLVKNSGTNYDYAWATVGGGGGSVDAQDEGSLVVSGASAFDFVGAGVTVTDGGGGTATVTIAGGGAVSSVFGRSGAVVATSGDYTFAQIASTPTTLAGYGITDAASSSHTHTFASLTSKPTTLAGYGITDAAASSHTHATGDITSGTFADARISESSVTQHQAALALAATQITSGTLPDARFPATLPAASGVNLTALNASNLASGTVNHARLGTGGGGATKFLREDNSWQTISGGGDALTSNPLSQFAATTSAQLAGVISDETGSGALVFATSPTLVTPTLGVATATTINKVTFTAPATGSTLTIADGATLTVNGSATITNGTHSGTNTGDQTTITGNAGTATALQTARTINGTSFNGTANITVTAAAGTLTGSTLASGVTASSLTSVGTLASLTLGGPVTGGDSEVRATVSRDHAYYASAPTISGGTLTLDYTAGPVFKVSLNANVTTLTITNPPASGPMGVLNLRLTADGTARTITWPASVRWGTAGAPTLTSTNGKVDWVQMVTVDGGTTWDAFMGGQNF